MIPVQNIYYLLSYAWDKLTESDTLSSDIDDYQDLVNLLSRVLCNGCKNLLKRGINSNYIDVEEAYRGIKGKLLFAESIKTNHLTDGIAICVFDEYTHDTLPNRIIKATLYRLLKCASLEKELSRELMDIYRRFHGVSLLGLRSRHFSQVRLHRNNYHYHFILKICRIIHDNINLNERTGQYEFQDFLRDRNMASLFEAFLLNFYKKHSGFNTVKAEQIHWKATAIGENSVPLPSMLTDISLINNHRKIIMDAKFYNEALQTNYNKETIRSSHLYQLYAYLKNEKSQEHFTTEGILIYPTVCQELDEKYLVDGFPVTIATINLNQEWRLIERDLISLVHQGLE